MRDKIKSILYEVCDDERVYEEDIDLLEEVIDSMALIELFTKLEEEFSIKIEPTEIPLDNLRSVDGIIELVEGEIIEDD